VKNVIFSHNGRGVPVKTDDSVLNVLLAQHIPVPMACKGRGMCATCHVYIEKGAQSLSPKSKKEIRTLGLLTGCDSTSRLACQARVVSDGVVVRLPVGLYVEETVDLEALIGRRTEVPLLHPVTGSVVLPGGKIMTRTLLEKLRADASTDLSQALAKSTEV